MNLHFSSIGTTSGIGHQIHAHAADIRKFVYLFFAAMVLIAGGLLLRPTFEQMMTSSSVDEYATPRTFGQAPAEVSVPQDFVPAVPVESPVRLRSADTKRLQFARMEVHRFANLLPILSSRMGRETNPQSLEKMKASIESLARKIAETELATNQLRGLTTTAATSAIVARLPFARESLRESLLAMQDAAQSAVSVFVDADNRADSTPEETSRDQLFNSNRTGQ